jgi:hypothetical protein|tara:strand:- start:744 stop:968 length:225 start_codon:yes stop_codon:yes gene_type:complete
MVKPHANWQEKIKRKNAGRFLECTCATCDVNLQIVLDSTGNIISGGHYFSGHLDEGEAEWEYWECINCYEDGAL